MLNFLISIVVFAASVFLLGVSIRYGLRSAGRLDEYFTAKSNRSFTGFNWYYRIPFSVGFIPEYYFYLVIGRDNYFKTNWWPLKTSAFISVLLSVAILKSRSAVYDYFTLAFVKQHGFTALFTSGSFIWFLNIITLLYFVLFVLVVIESIKMHGAYSPVRIIIYTVLSFLMADLTIIVLGLIVLFSVIYIILKIIKFIFFSSKRSRHREEEDDDETLTETWQKGLTPFKAEVKAWEQELKAGRVRRTKSKKPKHKPKIRRRKPKIKRTSSFDDDIPRLHPD